MNRSDILNTALSLVRETREQEYGSPQENFKLIGKLWSDYTGAKIDSSDVAVMMCLLKAARAKTGIKEDNYVDMAGYAALAGELAGEWVKEPAPGTETG